MAKISNLKHIQKEVDPKMIKKVKDGVNRGDKFDSVATFRNFIVNGNHRTAAKRQLGHKTIKTHQASKQEMLDAIKKKVKVAKGGNVGKENG
jgi:hypothetical protein